MEIFKKKGTKNINNKRNKKFKKIKFKKNDEKMHPIKRKKEIKENNFKMIINNINKSKTPIKKVKNKKQVNKKQVNKKQISKKKHSISNKKKAINAINDNDNKEKNKGILIYNDNELNSLIYNKALIYDKRTYFQYYLSLLKLNHLLIFSFYCNDNDYNSQIIKMFLFFFYFAVHLTINALFFSDGTMHQIYIEEGHFNFIYQLSQIIYSSLISGIITALIKFLSLSEKGIVELKSENKNEEFDLKEKKLISTLKIKFGFFFFISFLLLLIFGFYITCFCGIYENTGVHLIKDSLISFGLSLIYPFGILLLPGIFRKLALNAEKKDSEYLYKFSQFIEDI